MTLFAVASALVMKTKRVGQDGQGVGIMPVLSYVTADNEQDAVAITQRGCAEHRPEWDYVSGVAQKVPPAKAAEPANDAEVAT